MSGPLNTFLKQTEEISDGFGLRPKFSKRNFDFSALGLFSKNSLNGMLEAADFESVDQVSLFLGEICDRLC